MNGARVAVITQNKNQALVDMTRLSLTIVAGLSRFNGVDFNGTLHVATSHDDDFIGIVFGYQSSKKFYAVIWKQSAQTYWNMNPFRATASSGLQVKVRCIPGTNWTPISCKEEFEITKNS